MLAGRLHCYRYWYMYALTSPSKKKGVICTVYLEVYLGIYLTKNYYLTFHLQPSVIIGITD